MKSWKIKFLEKSVLGQNTDQTDSEIVLDKCIGLAYRDMLTAGRFYTSKFKNDKNNICSTTKKIIQNENFIFSKNIIEQVADLFSDTEIISIGDKYVTRYGLSQKLVNMSFKYFYIFIDYIFDNESQIDFSNCDCPLDSIILNAIPYNKTVWSKFTKAHYIECQNKISDLLKSITLDDELKSLGNMAYDFLHW